MQQFALSQAIAIGVRNFAAAELGEEVKIKWPNDIFYEGRKLGGLLIENLLSGEGYLQASVVGVGINVNQTTFEGLSFSGYLTQKCNQTALPAAFAR